MKNITSEKQGIYVTTFINCRLFSTTETFQWAPRSARINFCAFQALWHELLPIPLGVVWGKYTSCLLWFKSCVLTTVPVFETLDNHEETS